MEHFFSPNSSTDLRSDTHQSQIIGGDAGEDHTQLVGGIQSNYWGGYIPQHLQVLAPLNEWLSHWAHNLSLLWFVSIGLNTTKGHNFFTID